MMNFTKKGQKNVHKTNIKELIWQLKCETMFF